MTLAATMAGVGFGNAGVHLAHGCSYAVSGLNTSKYRFDGYEADFVPHGVSVVLTAPAIFRATAAACPGRHAELAAILKGENPPVVVALGGGGNVFGGAADARGAGEALAEQLLRYMEALGVPDGLGALGFSERDVPALVRATLPQRRVLNLAPGGEADASAEALASIFERSMKNY
jgi:hydroxyacid-oxoacid transhydrogenase